MVDLRHPGETGVDYSHTAASLPGAPASPEEATMNSTSELAWDASVWKEIDDAVLAEMGRVRSAQKVLPATQYDTNPTEVANDVINFTELSIREGQTKSFVELFQEFTLTSAQAMNEPQLKTCYTLAQMAAKSIALAEDTV